MVYPVDPPLLSLDPRSKMDIPALLGCSGRPRLLRDVEVLLDVAAVLLLGVWERDEVLFARVRGLRLDLFGDHRVRYGPDHHHGPRPQGEAAAVPHGLRRLVLRRPVPVIRRLCDHVFVPNVDDGVLRVPLRQMDLSQHRPVPPERHQFDELLSV